jgi:hypothetical protein
MITIYGKNVRSMHSDAASRDFELIVTEVNGG